MMRDKPGRGAMGVGAGQSEPQTQATYCPCGRLPYHTILYPGHCYRRHNRTRRVFGSSSTSRLRTLQWKGVQ